MQAFIWDQCLLTSFSEIIPKVAVCTLLILQGPLLQATSMKEVRRVVDEGSRLRVTIRSLQVRGRAPNDATRRHRHTTMRRLGIGEDTEMRITMN